jgi:hypothetical protein
VGDHVEHVEGRVQRQRTATYGVQETADDEHPGRARGEGSRLFKEDQLPGEPQQVVGLIAGPRLKADAHAVTARQYTLEKTRKGLSKGRGKQLVELVPQLRQLLRLTFQSVCPLKTREELAHLYVLYEEIPEGLQLRFNVKPEGPTGKWPGGLSNLKLEDVFVSVGDLPGEPNHDVLKRVPSPSL